MKTRTVIELAAIIFLVALMGGGYNFANNMRKIGVQKEIELSAQFKDNQNYLSAYISGFYEQVEVAGASKKALNEVLLSAVKGRYDKEGFKANGAFFAAVVEAYPESSTQELMKQYSRIQAYVQSQREGYRAVQSLIQDKVRSYNSYLHDDIMREFFLTSFPFHFPTSNLVAEIGGKEWKGEEALKKISELVLTEQAIGAYEKGKMEPLKIER